MAILKQEYLLDYIGRTATKNILNDAKAWLLENKMKELGYLPRPNCVSMVHTLVKNTKEIQQIGGSTPPDLICDNMGEMFSAWHRPISGTSANVSMNDIAGAPQSFAQFFRNNVSGGTNALISMFSTRAPVNCGIQIGEGVTPPTRQDVNIEQAFSNGGLEDNRNIISPPTYNVVLSRCEFGLSIVSTGSGTISETALINSYHNTTAHASSLVLLARDAINPTVNFISAQNIFMEYLFQF